MILCIDTAIEHCGVGICRDAVMVDSIDNDTYMRASEVLHQMIKDLLDRNKLRMQDLSAVAINGGPGSYTGLRIGASSAKGLCYALDIPLIHINGLELMTEGMINRGDQGEFEYFVPMIDARRDEVFTAVYDRNHKVLLPPQPMILESGSFSNYTSSRTLFFGNGAEKAEQILASNTNSQFRNFSVQTQDFEQLTWYKWVKKEFEDPVRYTPSYLKKFHFIGPKTSG